MLGYVLRQLADLVTLPIDARPFVSDGTFANHICELHYDIKRKINMNNVSYKFAADVHLRKFDFS